MILHDGSHYDLLKVQKENKGHEHHIKSTTPTRAQDLIGNDVTTYADDDVVQNMYDEIVKFDPTNFFIPSSSNCLKAMLEEMTRLLQNYVNDGPSKHVSLTILMSMPKLLL